MNDTTTAIPLSNVKPGDFVHIINSPDYDSNRSGGNYYTGLYIATSTIGEHTLVGLQFGADHGAGELRTFHLGPQNKMIADHWSDMDELLDTQSVMYEFADTPAEERRWISHVYERARVGARMIERLLDKRKAAEPAEADNTPSGQAEASSELLTPEMILHRRALLTDVIEIDGRLYALLPVAGPEADAVSGLSA